VNFTVGCLETEANEYDGPAVGDNVLPAIDEAIDDMFPPLRDTLADVIEVEEFAMKDPPLFEAEGVAAAHPTYAYGSDTSHGRQDTDNEFDDVDYDTKPSGNKVGGEFSTKKEALLILRRFLSKEATLTSPSLFAKMTEKGYYFSPSDEDNNYIPEEETTEGLYDNDELIQDDKEEDLVDLSYYKTDTGHGVGHKLNKGRTPKPDVTGMSLLEATIVLNQWKVQRKAYNDQVQREHMKTLGTKTPPGIQHSGVLNSQLRMISEV